MQLAPVLTRATTVTPPFGPRAAAAAPAAPTAPAAHAAAPTAPAPPMPTERLVVPAPIEDALAGAVERGRREATSWIAAHPHGTIEQLQEFVLAQVGAPPTGAAAEADHALVREAVAHRTPAQDATAVWIDEYGLFPPWQPTIDTYVASVGADQAKAGLSLLDRAKQITSLLTFPVKDHHMRERPFQVHGDTPLLAGITHVRGGSFPSGHASLAYAHHVVFSTLLPNQASATKAMADQLSFARTYAAAHFPSDIVTGAYIGSIAATFAAARPDVVIPERSKP